MLVSALAHRQGIDSITAAPPMLASFGSGGVEGVQIPEQPGYRPEFVAKLKELGVKFVETLTATVRGMRGTLAAVAIDSGSGRRSAAHQPMVMVYNESSITD